MSNNQMMLQLPVPKGYKQSTLLSRCTPEEIRLILYYGEQLLLSHKSLVVKNIADSKYKNLEIELLQERKEKTKLRRENEEIQMLYKKNLCNIQEKNEIELKKELQTIELCKLSEIEKIKSLHKKELQYIENTNNNINNHWKNQYNNLEHELETMKENIERKYKNEIEIIKKNYDVIIQELKTQNDTTQRLLQTAINDERSQCSEAIMQIQSNHEQIINDLKKHYKTNNDEHKEWMLEEFKSVLNYHDNTNVNTIKGDIGEQTIINLLKNIYDKAIIKNTSKGSHQSDILFEDYNPDIKCIIEVKKKKTIITTDITKFEEDIITQQDNNINCALFISMDSNNIPKKGNFHLEIFNKIPVLYICLKSPEYIQFAIELLKNMVNKLKEVSEKTIPVENLHTDVSNIITNLYNSINISYNNIKKNIPEIKKQLKTMEETKIQMEKNLQLLNTFIDTHKQLNINPSVKISVEETYTFSSDDIKKLKKWTKENKTIPDKPEILNILNITNTYKSSQMKVRKTQNELKKYLSDLEKFDTKK